MKMTEKLIVFTHNDLDGLGCMLNIEYKFPNVPKQYFFTNYSDIVEKTDQIIKYIIETGNTHLIAPDISFSDNGRCLYDLDKIAKVTHIDHHMYPPMFWDEFSDKMKVIYDPEKSAALLCNEYLGNTGKNDKLDRLTQIINIYDLWQKTHPAFDFAQDFNNFFWQHDMIFLCNEIIKNDFKLPDNFHSVVQQFNKDAEAALQDYEKRNLIHRADGITVCFTDGWFNQLLIKEMKAGQKMVVGSTPYGVIRIRINDDADYTDEQKNELRKALTGNMDYGNMNCFTYKSDYGLDNIMKEMERVLHNIKNIM